MLHVTEVSPIFRIAQADKKPSKPSRQIKNTPKKRIRGKIHTLTYLRHIHTFGKNLAGANLNNLIASIHCHLRLFYRLLGCSNAFPDEESRIASAFPGFAAIFHCFFHKPPCAMRANTET
ncbi:MAG: hypothetical protein R8K53_09915 [Mariprofundaceae bacterium]